MTQMCTAHVMRLCHQIDRSFVCKAKEGRHTTIVNKLVVTYQE